MSRLGRREHLTSSGKEVLAILLNSSHFNTFTWRPSAGPISSSHGGPVQGPSPVHMEVQCRAHLQFQCRAHLLNQVQGTQHSWAAASQGSIIKVPGLKDKVSTLVICIQAGHQCMQNQCKQQGCHPAVLQTLS